MIKINGLKSVATTLNRAYGSTHKSHRLGPYGKDGFQPVQLKYTIKINGLKSVATTLNRAHVVGMGFNPSD